MHQPVVAFSDAVLEKQEAEAQKKADQYWKPLLVKWRSALGDKDKDKYLAIGESDRMTLRFVKPAGSDKIFSSQSDKKDDKH